jgi:Major Facilitator Superfamily
VLLYPVYALLFADAGLSGGQLSSLFAIWSMTGFVLEVPSGAWADTFSRRRLVAVALLLRSAGFALWVLWPSYPGFAVGFVLWGASGAMTSGTVEALVYDELAATKDTDRYVRVVGRGNTVALLSMLAATALAAPAHAAGGYPLVGAASVAVGLAGAAAALSFPETRPQEQQGVRGYVATLRAGLHEVRGQPRVARAVVLLASVTGLTAVDEYFPLLARDAGAGTTAVALLATLPIAAAAVASALAGRWSGIAPGRLGAALGAAGVALAAGSLARHPAGMVAVAACFGLLELFTVVGEARLQEAMSGRARATVLSVTGLGSEVAALAVFAGFGLGESRLDLNIPVLMALAALPLAGAGLLTRGWLPVTAGRDRGRRSPPGSGRAARGG